MHLYRSAPVSLLARVSRYRRFRAYLYWRHHELARYPDPVSRYVRTYRRHHNAQLNAHLNAHALGMVLRPQNSPYNQLFRKFRITTHRRRGRAISLKLGGFEIPVYLQPKRSHEKTNRKKRTGSDLQRNTQLVRVQGRNIQHEYRRAGV